MERNSKGIFVLCWENKLTQKPSRSYQKVEKVYRGV